MGNFRDGIDLKGVGDDLGKMLEDTGLGSFVSDIKKAAEDVGSTSGNVGVKLPIKIYFKEVREACACMYPQDSDYEYLYKKFLILTIRSQIFLIQKKERQK